MKDLSLPGSRVSAANWKRTALILGLAGMMGSSLPFASAATATMTTMTLTSDGSPVTSVEPHTAITLTAVVKAGSTALKQGQVKFCDTTPSCQDIHLLGLSQLTTAGTATLKFVAGPGSHSYRAVFVGTNTDASSASAVSSVTVISREPYASKTTLAATGNAGSYNFKTDVSGVGATLAPTGTVYLQDRSNAFAEVGKAQLSAGVQELSWSTWQSGKIPHSSRGPMQMADFNGDGHTDLVLIDISYGDRLLLGDGEGHFKMSKLPFKTAFNTGAVSAVGDFNNDGKPDIVRGLDKESLAVFLGNGDGTFTRVETSGVSPAHFSSLSIGDFNGDGNEDIVVSDETSDTVQTFLGNGDGTFQTGMGTYSRRYFSPLLAGDFDGDGKEDLVVQSEDRTSGGAQILLGQGDGSFIISRIPQQVHGDLTVADVNGDGLTDLIAVAYDDAKKIFTLTVLLGNADRTFTALRPIVVPTYIAAYGGPAVALLGDYNGDGIVDLAFCAGDAINGMNVLLGDGKGSFAPATVTGAPPFQGDYFSPKFDAVGDFNEDGSPDIASVLLLTTAADPFDNSAVIPIFSTYRHLAVTVSGKALQSAGAHEVVARYHGDDNFQTSVSKPVELMGLTGSSPVATLSALAVPFGDGAVGSSSNAKTVVLTNTGTAALAVGSFTLSPVSGSGVSFATSNDCPASLAVGAACKIRFRFVPGSSGVKTSRLAITDNAGNSPQVITLTGNGIAEPE